jgi:pyrophosphatase PpaX
MVCKPGLSCIIFDVDGTLTRTNALIFASFNHVASRHLGRTFAPEEIIALFGPPEEGALQKVFGPDGVDLLMEELLEFYAANHLALASLHSGIEDLLRFLRAQGLRLAVFTGKGRRTTAITLDTLRVAHYFDLIVTGNDVEHHKPHPEGILRILSHLDVRAGESLMIGDSLSDIRASRAAGVPIASVLWDAVDAGRVRDANPDFLFETVEGMLFWFHDMFRNGRMDNGAAAR